MQITNKITHVNTKGRSGLGLGDENAQHVHALDKQSRNESQEGLTLRVPSPRRLCRNVASPVCSSPRRDCGSAGADKREGDAGHMGTQGWRVPSRPRK